MSATALKIILIVLSTIIISYPASARRVTTGTKLDKIRDELMDKFELKLDDPTPFFSAVKGIKDKKITVYDNTQSGDVKACNSYATVLALELCVASRLPADSKIQFNKAALFASVQTDEAKCKVNAFEALVENASCGLASALDTKGTRYALTNFAIETKRRYEMTKLGKKAMEPKVKTSKEVNSMVGSPSFRLKKVLNFGPAVVEMKADCISDTDIRSKAEKGFTKEYNTMDSQENLGPEDYGNHVSTVIGMVKKERLNYFVFQDSKYASINPFELHLLSELDVDYCVDKIYHTFECAEVTADPSKCKSIIDQEKKSKPTGEPVKLEGDFHYYKTELCNAEKKKTAKK